MITVIHVIGCILVFVGILLTIPSLCSKIKVDTVVGWSMSAIGMLLLAFYGFASGRILFAILCLIFTAGDMYFSVSSLKK